MQSALKRRRDKVIIVTRKTMLEELILRFNTLGQARFYLEHAGEDIAPLERTHERYHEVLRVVTSAIPGAVKHQVIDRAFLPQFSFGEGDLVVTVGPDGLVVNTAKYLREQPILAVNPDPVEVEGVLLPFDATNVVRGLRSGLLGEIPARSITMAEAKLSDGQRLVAFNDLFIGVRSHVSARYRVAHGGRSEEHSSSGVLVATGAGSTGWLRSIYAGAADVARGLGGKLKVSRDAGRFAWDAEKLVFVVREPWPSKTTGANLVHGEITRGQPLTLVSRMADNGVIFSDGVEADYLSFTAGLTATIRIADVKAHLLQPQ